MKNVLLTAAALICVASASIGQSLPAYLPADGLVGWWPFNGNANDESGNGNDGYNYLFNGSAFYLNPSPSNSYGVDRNGNIERALKTNIYGSNVMLPINNFLFQSDFTISIWAKNDSLVAQYPTILESSNNHLTMQFGNTGGPISFGAYLTEIGISPFGEVGALTQPLEWLHITLVNENYQNKLYFNGNLVDSTNDFNSQQAQTDWMYLRVGNGNQLPQGSFYGLVDDIAIFNRALSQEEITALYTGEPVNPPSACNPLPSNLQNGLVGYWPFCGNANDESGNGNDGTVNGATLTEDRFWVANSAYDFDGIGDNVLIDSMPFCENYTFNCWLRCDTIFTPYPEIYNTSNANENNRLHLVGNIYPFNEQGKVFTGDDNNGNLATSTSNVNDNNWNMITVIYDYTNNDVKLLVNGEVEATETIINPSTFEGALKFGNGFSQQPNPQPYDSKGFVGHLDDIGIWNRALTAEEVQELYTLNACTFSIYDTTYVTIYDTVSVSTTDTLIINTLITGVQPAQENTFLVYPNPAGSQITINNGNVSILGGYTMRISNSIGQEVYNQNITQTEVTLDLSNWGGNGLYVLYILDPQGEIIAVKQIVLQ